MRAAVPLPCIARAAHAPRADHTHPVLKEEAERGVNEAAGATPIAAFPRHGFATVRLGAAHLRLNFVDGISGEVLHSTQLNRSGAIVDRR